MDRFSRIGVCLILLVIYWVAIADSQSQCKEVGFDEKCEVCTDDKTCPRCAPIPNVECGHENKCRCKPGYSRVYGGGSVRCVQAPATAQFGESCNNGNAFCSEEDNILCDPNQNNICECERGFHRDNVLKLCISNDPIIFDFCSPNAQPDRCNKNPALKLKCDRSINICVVEKGWRYNCTTLGTEEVKEYGESCKSIKCNPDSNLECNNESICVCKEGYEYHKMLSKCVKYREYNESCKDIKCNPVPDSNLECNDDLICVCKEGLFEYDEEENRCVICVEKEDKGVTLEGALIAILVAVYVGVLGEVGLIVWLCRRNRRVSPGDEEEGKKRKKKPKGKKDTKSKNLPKQIKKSKKDLKT